MEDKKVIPFEVETCGSEEMGALASGLASGKGVWTSDRFPLYPIELIFSFPFRAKLNQIKILTNPPRVPTKIEILIPDEGGNFRKLGFAPLNAPNDINAREMRVVSINQLSNKMKLLIYKPHPHRDNLLDQVSLTGFSILGISAPPEYPKQQNVPSLINTIPQMQSNSITHRFSPLMNKLEDLNQIKRRAVMEEDYVTAKKVKEEETIITNKIKYLEELERDKLKAVEEEDFETAIELKAKIAYEMESLSLAEKVASPLNEVQKSISPSIVKDEQKTVIAQNEIMSVSSVSSNTLPTELVKSADVVQSPVASPLKEKSPERPMSSVLPNDNCDPFTSLSLKSQRKVELLLPFFKDHYLIKAFGPVIAERISAITDMLDLSLDKSLPLFALDQLDITELLYGKLKYLHAMLEERSPVIQGLVQTNLLDLFNLLSDQSVKEYLSGKVDFSQMIREIMTVTLDRGADGALLLSKALLAGGALSLGDCFEIGLKENINKLESPRQKITRVRYLLGLISEHEFGDNGYKLKTVLLDFGVELLLSPNREIREAARDLFIVLANFMGQSAIIDHLVAREVPKNYFEEVLKRFKQMSDQSKQPIASSVYSRPAPTVDDTVSIALPEEKPLTVEQNDVCYFCNKHCSSFNDPDVFDAHLWKDCPVLLNCDYCKQIIEVSEYKNHRISECGQPGVSLCSQCDMPVYPGTLESHRASSYCQPLPLSDKSLRCPLCYNDFIPDSNQTIKDAWKVHLTKDCKSNTRRPLS